MARRPSKKRVEPTFGGMFDLRLRDDDRPSGGGRGGRGPAKPRRRGGRSGGGRRGSGRRRRGIIGRLIGLAVTLCLIGLAGFGGLIAMHWDELPAVSELEIPKRPPSVVMTSSTGSTFATRGAMGESVAFDELPAHVSQAVIAIEDRRFYAHFGVDPIGLSRAAFANFTSGGVVQGGSTITQQLAKNLFLTSERTLSRKVQELFIAFWLEAEFSKERILELYLNRVYLGSGAHGVEAASQRYFGKSARHISLTESAILAGLLKAPSRYSPARDMDVALDRAAVVLNDMVDAGFISAAQAQDALSQPVSVARSDREASSNYVADWVMDLVPAFIGEIEEDLVVETTLDLILQDAAEHALGRALDAEGAALNASQGALVAMDSGGAVRALVGGRSYAASQFNRAVDARRQPGSAFKPFVYLAALERGLTPDSVRQDGPVRIGNWTPENFDKKYRGPVTLRDALALSLNTVAARLGAEVGPEAVARTAQRLGISSPLAANGSIALGTSEVSLLELVTAYVPFSNGGKGVIPHVITEIRTRAGDVLYERRMSGLGPVVAPSHVAMMNSMLVDTLARGTGKRAELPGWRAAGKTGTSQNFRDALFVGYTPNLTAGIWLGNDDGTSMKRATGGSLPAAIWSAFMQDAHRGLPVAELYGADMPHFAAAPQPSMEIPAGYFEPAPQQRHIEAPQIVRGVGGFLRNLFGG